MSENFALVLGDLNVDLVIPLRDQKGANSQPREEKPQLHGGGTGGNSAAALARLGIPVRFIGTVGDDGYGRWSADDLLKDGVDTRYLQFTEQAFTTIVLAVILPDGERDLFVWPDSDAAHTRLSPETITPGMFESASWLHTTGLCLREEPVRGAQLKAMRLAREAGASVSLDLNLRLESWGMDDPLREVFNQAISLADVIFGSGSDEILPFTGSDSIQAGAEALSDGQRTVIARLGPKGALGVAPGGSFFSPAFEIPVVDTLGAGDAFNGGFICARLGGYTIEDSVRWGNAAAALKIGRKGARGLPERRELIEFIKAQRID